jgi:magnesium chelatase family protein
MTSRDLGLIVKLSGEARRFFNAAAEKLGFSARGYHRTLKLARTIADLAGEENITLAHLSEAIQYRPKQEEVI